MLRLCCALGLFAALAESFAAEPPKVVAVPGGGLTFESNSTAKVKRGTVQARGAIYFKAGPDGYVTEAHMVQRISPMVDAAIISYARKNWRGPANSSKTVPVTFVLE